jgi:SAM-dependent methyltransferase
MSVNPASPANPPAGADRAAPPAGARPDPTPLVKLSTAFWDSQVLLTANRLKLFDVLVAGPQSPEQVAAALALDTRAVTLFLRACAGLGLLEESAGRYSNSPAAAAFLVSRSPAYLGGAMRYSDQLYGTWGQLEQALRSGRPALAAEVYLGDDAEKTRTFVHSMHGRALGIARALVEILDLGGRRELLDVGGGPGTYSMLLTQKHAGLRAEVLELPGVAAVARELVASAGAQDRVRFRDGDYHDADFGTGRDVVLMSGMFHRETPDACRRLVARAWDCLQPGGMLAISDVFTDAGGTRPSFAAMFGLNMMLTAPDGGVHADADVRQWMGERGFVELRTTPLPPPMPHRVVTGIKP